jgi:hydrogenase maturation protein HypF
MQALLPEQIVAAETTRLRLDLSGCVQGVGFRPYVFRLANAERLHGFVRNTAQGVTVEVEGTIEAVNRFVARLDNEMPPQARVFERRAKILAPRRDGGSFIVSPSSSADAPSALVMPDLATCSACLGEMLDPADRRFGYAFTTCMHCGPRYSIVHALPYDRERTAMRDFPMCARCLAEYRDPVSRRFHAETVACPDCGPQPALWCADGRELAAHADSIRLAAAALREGRIVAVKGLGGYQLLADASNADAVRGLRERKQRPSKPFATMFPTLAMVERAAHVSAAESLLLLSPQAPIVILRARQGGIPLAAGIAPGNPSIGVMLPCTPLHHLLLMELAFPVVATSGNARDEPIATSNCEALDRLGGIADMFLVHDRPILHAVDDSVVRVIAGREVVLRRARGYAPMPFAWRHVTQPVLALGGQQKNAVATGFGGRIFLGPHIGDLASPLARDACERAARELPALHALQPVSVACDAHPDYASSRLAERSGLPVVRVPHHLAHVVACMVDNEIEAPVLGVAWDGSGYGGDGTVWGGEFLGVRATRYRRYAHLFPFRLPGGEAAVREPRRAALGVLHAIFGASCMDMSGLAPIAAFTRQERSVLAGMLSRGVNAPLASSAGRLFDAAAAILDLFQVASFEGEAAMAVEFAADRAPAPAALPAPALIEHEQHLVLDWRPTFAAMVEQQQTGVAAESLAAGLHAALADSIVCVAQHAGISRVLLTGGCFQNTRLTACALERLRHAGFEPYSHHRIPPNDGGLAAGQIAFAARPLLQETR